MSVSKKKPAMPLFSKLPNTVSVQRTHGGLVFWWSRKGVGFGSLTLVVRRGKLIVDSECMSAAFCAAVVRQAIKEAGP